MATPTQISLPTMPEPEIVPAHKRTGRIVGAFMTGDTNPRGFQTGPVANLTLALDGIEGSRHRGWTMPADSRVPYLQRGTPMRGTRSVSLVSIEDLAEVAKRLDIATIDPRWIGANITVEGIERLSFLPRGTKLFCDGGAILVVEGMNAPCRGAGAAIAGHTGRAEIELGFAKVAQRLRGLVASVEHPGTVTASTTVTARVPEQWLYR
jgi:hypothetical protein